MPLALTPQMKELDRANVAGVRRALATLGAVVAEVDRELRYLWIDNPHPDFDSGALIGKRDDELIAALDAADIMSLKHATESILTVGFDVPAPAQATD